MARMKRASTAVVEAIDRMLAKIAAFSSAVLFGGVPRFVHEFVMRGRLAIHLWLLAIYWGRAVVECLQVVKRGPLGHTWPSVS